MPRSTDSGLPQRGHGSPDTTATRSAHCPTSKSRPSTALRTWWSVSFAPVTHAVRCRHERVGDDERDARAVRARCSPSARSRGAWRSRRRRTAAPCAARARARARTAFTSRSPGTSARPSSPSSSRTRCSSGGDRAARPRCSATAAMPGMSGVCTFSFAGASTPAPRCARWRAARDLDVRRVVAALAPDEVVLADRGDGHELVVDVAADLARLRLDRPEREPAPLEDARVRVVHVAVACAAGPRRRRRTSTRPSSGTRARAAGRSAGRSSSRYFQLIWYRFTRQVAVARVLPRDDRRDRPPRPSARGRTRRSLRSSRRNMSGPYAASRPDCFHSSSGWAIGSVISCAPAPSISSRTICSTLRSTRWPSGSQA